MSDQDEALILLHRPDAVPVESYCGTVETELGTNLHVTTFVLRGVRWKNRAADGPLEEVKVMMFDDMARELVDQANMMLGHSALHHLEG